MKINENLYWYNVYIRKNNFENDELLELKNRF